MTKNHSVLVVSYTAPELTHFATALAEQGLLQTYIRPYANQRRDWERAINAIPALGGIYARTFGRREMPPELKGHIKETAVWQDLGRAGILHFVGSRGKAVTDRLNLTIQKRLATVASRHAAEADVVVGNAQVSYKMFARTTGLKVLNYPTVYHRYVRQFVAEETELEPSFASTLPDWNRFSVAWQETELDTECENADRILVGSQFARTTFMEDGFPAEKMVVIPYGADLKRFSPEQTLGVQKKIFRVLFVGGILQRKGISYLLRAYHRFKGPNTELLLVGRCPDESSPFAPFRDDFKHIPHVPQAELSQIYRSADVFVFPTLIEGMGLVVLEAMASGLPVITTPNGPGDLVRDGVDGFVIPIRDVDAIVEKLEFLRTHPEDALRMGQNARERAKEFTWEHYKEKVTEFIHAL